MRVAAVAAVVLGTTPLIAQMPAFDAASVRPSAQRAAGADWVIRPGGQFMASNITLPELIGVAYGLETFRVVGAPEWARTAQYDVQARGAADVAADETRLMLRTLLRERFALRATAERREMPIYALVIGRSDRSTGPRLRPASECTGPTCGRLFTNPGRMTGRSVKLDLLALRLSPLVTRVVVNQTGITGLFDLDLDFTPDSGPSLATAGAPALFTALAEQLGLRLESSTGPADVLVIESVERPMEN